MALSRGALCLALCLLATLVAPAQAQVYRVIDENGNVTFTDKPPPGGEEVDVRAPNTAKPPAASTFPKAAEPARDADKAGSNYTVTITSPADETIIPRGPGNFSVSASVTPGLRGGEKLQLLMDGSAHDEPRQAGNWSLTNVSRGEHTLAVAVVDGSGSRLATSDSVKVYVYRPSLNDGVNTPRPGIPRPQPRARTN
ncbi:MAG: DUF4124 domain-containing protein [Halieaceae bacterium]|nr:DUF4124 domain-containing protein [Halieaceae bacterium]